MALPQHKQMLVLSATYPADLAATLASYMRDPVHVRIDVENPSLEGKVCGAVGSQRVDVC